MEAMVEGDHEYKEIWDAALDEQLQSGCETDNKRDLLLWQ